MSISGTEATTPAGMFAGLANTATSNISTDKQTFMQLLVAQLKYQDPMNPTDSSQFLSQSAQFTALEKMQSVADQTAAMVSTTMAFGASSLVGKGVEYVDSTGANKKGTVTGVSFGSSGPVLTISGASVPMSNLVSVGSVVAAPAATTPTTSSTTPTTTTPATPATSPTTA